MISSPERDSLRQIRASLIDVLLSANKDEPTYNRWHDSNSGLSSMEVRTLASAVMQIDDITGDETRIWSDLSKRRRARA
jgi:hypothetical protein